MISFIKREEEKTISTSMTLFEIKTSKPNKRFYHLRQQHLPSKVCNNW